MPFRLRICLGWAVLGGVVGVAFAAEDADTTVIQADRIVGRNDVETVAEGSVELRRAESIVTADHLKYRHLDDEVEAEGNVRLTRDEDVISGPRMRLRVQDNEGVFEHPHYLINRLPKSEPQQVPTRQPVAGTGDASRLDFEGEGLYRFTSATYSTCSPPNRDWYVEADEIDLDYNHEVGEASRSKVVFKDMPIFYWPSLSFSLNHQRRSGLLAPTFGSSTTSGLELTLPWYWNIAPNMDATIAPRVLSRRGVQLNSELRYLDYAYNGQARLEYLPNDLLTGTSRSAYAILHNHVLGPGLTGNVNLNGVSDDRYFADLSSKVAMVSQANLLRQGSLTYGAGWWTATLTAQRFQTLQDPAAPVAIPYYRLPQLTLTALRPDLPAGLAFNFAGEFVDFSHPTQVIGQRTVLYPQVSLPLQTAAFYVTPKIGVHMTRYSLSRQAAGEPDQLSRQVPIMSVDSGVVFERDVHWFGRSLTQTLEPRIFYLNVPARDQSKLPVFDSGLLDFNFAQIFAENRYGGGDRIGDANQLTTAVVSRLIDPSTGSELMRGAVGQRFYFRDQQVTLPYEVARTTRKTDLLAAFSGRVLPQTFLDTGWQYSPNFGRTERFNIGGRYQPEFGKVLNAGYRYTRDQFGQVDISGQWPLAGRWYGVGRYNYSLKEKRLIEGVAGLEYDAGCWIGRFVLHRLGTTTATVSTGLFVQLELNGLARIGSNPLDLLKRNIAGYGLINQPTADPIFGAN
jgi:LPS-assembly protein